MLRSPASFHRCPTCQREFDERTTKVMPFCCERCQQVDLGRWLGEEYSVPVIRLDELDDEFEDFQPSE